MKRGATTALLVLLLVGGAALLASCDQKPVHQTLAPPPKPDSRVVYELREKCGKDAADWFKREHESDGVIPNSVLPLRNEYSNHYNERLNRCYAVVLRVDAFVRPKSESLTLQNATLADVNENREVGKYFANSNNAAYTKCSVEDSRCQSYEEWQALAKPFMEQ